MDRVRRTKQFAIRLSSEERARVDRLAEHYGLDVAALLRMIVKKEYDSVVSQHKKPEPTASLCPCGSGLPVNVCAG